MAWVRQAQLQVLVPRLFAHSVLSTRGQLAELTIFNRGWKTEEAIEIDLTPSLKYDIVGASTQGISLSNNKISIPRIGPGDEISLLLLVEGGDFSTSSITNCLSKEAKGRIVRKLSDLLPTGPQRVGLVATLVIPLVVFYFGFDALMSSPSRGADASGALAPSATAQRSTLQLKDWTISSIYSNEPLFKHFSDGKIQISIGRLERKGDITTVPVTFINKTPNIIVCRISMTTIGSQGRIPDYQQAIPELWLGPGRMSEKSIKVVIPAKSTDPSDKLIIMKAFLESNDGSTLKLDRMYQALE